MISREGIIHQQICDYLKMRYPRVLYRTDFAAGIKMTMGQATRHKRLQFGRAWPDLFIAMPKQGYHGLFIELKADNIYKQDGTLYANQHLTEQYRVLAKLEGLGYKAVFAVGFDQAREIIDEYLKT